MDYDQLNSVYFFTVVLLAVLSNNTNNLFSQLFTVINVSI